MIKGEQDISMQLMGLTNQLRRNADAITARYGGQKFTGMQSFILAYLFDREQDGEDVFQRDIEKEFYISRSTASGILGLMEKNGFINRLSVEQDARLKKIVMTDQARRTVTSIRNDLERMDSLVEGCLTPEEQKTMLALLDKMWRGMEEASLAVGIEPKFIRRDK